MDTISLVYIFVLGALIGSFINVVALRYNTGKSSLSGRSMCPSCNTPLVWYDLVPLVSFFALGGKCRYCKTKLSWRYPLVELIMGIIFVGIAVRQYTLLPLYVVFPHGILYLYLFFIYYAVVFSLLMIIVLYDMQHTIIPDNFVYTFMGLSVFKLFLFFYCLGFPFTLIGTLDFLSPLIISLPFAFLWFVSSGEWIGFGDAKLAFGIGAMLGFTLGISAIILAFWIGAAWSLCAIAYGRISHSSNTLTLASEVPFAPFLIIGALIVFFTHVDVMHIGSLLRIFS